MAQGCLPVQVRPSRPPAWWGLDGARLVLGLDALALQELPGHGEVVLGALGVRGVLEDRPREAGRLRELDVLRDRAAEQLLGEVGAELREHLPREAQAVVVHAREDPGDLEVRLHAAAQELHDLHELAEPLEREELRLHRDQHLAGGGQAVDRQQAEARRVVDQHHVRGGPSGALPLLALPVVEGVLEDRLAADGARQLQLGAGQVEVRRQHGEARGRRAPQGVGDPAALGEQRVGGRLPRLELGAQVLRGVGLGVHVDHEHPLAQAGQGRAEVDRGRGLPHAALLVDDRDSPHERAPESNPGRSAAPEGCPGPRPAAVTSGLACRQKLCEVEFGGGRRPASRP